jgi:hypothetical protein
MLNVAIGHGMGARKVGRYRVEDARPTDGLVVRTGVVAGIGVVAGTTTGVVAGTPLMDAHPVTRYRAETARPTDGEGEAGRELTCERRSAADRGEYRQAAGAIGPPSDVGSAMRRSRLFLPPPNHAVGAPPSRSD